MTKAERIKRITKLMGNIKQTPLSKKCGNCLRLMYNDEKTAIFNDNVVVKTIDNNTLSLSSLPSPMITKIFNDLKVDFSLL